MRLENERNQGSSGTCREEPKSHGNKVVGGSILTATCSSVFILSSKSTEQRPRSRGQGSHDCTGEQAFYP